MAGLLSGCLVCWLVGLSFSQFVAAEMVGWLVGCLVGLWSVCWLVGKWVDWFLVWWFCYLVG